MSCRVSAVMPSFRAIIYEDVEQAVKHAPKTTAPMQPGIPIETHKILGEFYEEHYRKRLPALGDRTPRHVASLKTMRSKLIALLKDLESHSEGQRRSGEIAYDFTWMWAESGSGSDPQPHLSRGERR